jgi:hypothetical protein
MLDFLPKALPLLMLLAVATCQSPKKKLPKSLDELEGTWLQSQEENRGDTLVYRPNTYAFPPARGRTGFEVKPYGRFTQYDIAPTDGLAGREGTWTADGLDRIRIHLEDGQEPDYTLELLSLHNQVLKVRRLQ